MFKYSRWTLVFLIGLGLSSSNAIGKKAAKSANDVMDLAKLAHGITVQIVTSTGMGSGVWVSDKGYIATCWHVVKDSDSITVQFGGTEHLDLENYRIATANFIHFGASVVDHDEISDVAILKLGGGANPFGGPPHTPEYVFPNPIAATFETHEPQFGGLVFLLGYPLGQPHLLVQNANISGSGFEHEPAAEPLPEIVKLTRIFVSVVSNPGNSGGPVVDASGHLIGLLHGNYPSPVKDEKGRVAMYVRPLRDESGKVVKDGSGNIQFEVAPQLENSGISIVIPSYFVKWVLERAMGATQPAK